MTDTTFNKTVVPKSDDATEPDPLTEKINDGHRRVEDAKRRAEQANEESVNAAIETGVWLIAKKAQLTHGEWGAWKRDKFAGSTRTAELYMQIARNIEESQGLAHLGISGLQKKFNDENSAKKPKKAQTVDNPEDITTPEDIDLARLDALLRETIRDIAAAAADHMIDLAQPNERESVAAQHSVMVRGAQHYLNRITTEPVDLSIYSDVAEGAAA